MAVTPTRSDALANRTALLDAAERVLGRQGANASLDAIAREAGVGIATLYRNFADRGELFTAVTHRAYQLVAELAAEADRSPAVPLEALKTFLLRILEHRGRLVLPLLGGPGPQDGRIDPLAERITESLANLLHRGMSDGTIRSDAAATDIIVAGAMLARAQLPEHAWRQVATRHAQLLVDGLRPHPGNPVLPAPLTRSELNRAMMDAADGGERSASG